MSSSPDPLLTPRRVIDGFGGCFVLAGLALAAAGAVFAPEESKNGVLALGFGLGLALLGFLLRAWLLGRMGRVSAAAEQGEYERDVFSARLTASTRTLRDGPGDPGPLELVAGTRRGPRVLFAGAFAVAFGGLAPGILWPPEGIVAQALFGACLLVGALAGAYAAREVFASTVPRPRIELGATRLVPGTATALRWSYPRRRGPRTLEVRLAEQALSLGNSGRSGSPSLDVEERRVVGVFSASSATAAREGEAKLLVPEDARPSFEKSASARRWTLVVEGRFSLGRRSRDEYVLWVH